MIASRESVVTVSHTGIRACSRRPQVKATKADVSSTLSAIGSSTAPSVVRWWPRRATTPSSRSVSAGDHEHDERPGVLAREHEHHQQRRGGHAQDRELVGDGEDGL